MDIRNMSRPPCWPAGKVCPNQCAAALYWRVIWAHTPLHGPWAGWRLAGARLIAPSGDWTSPDRLDRLLWRESRLWAARRQKERPTGAHLKP